MALKDIKEQFVVKIFATWWDDSTYYFVMDIVAIDLDKLHVFMKGGAASTEDGWLVVKIHRHWGRRRDLEFFEERVELHHLLCCHNHDMIIRLSTRAGYYPLLLWLPSDKVVTYVCTITISELAITLINLDIPMSLIKKVLFFSL